MLLSKRIAGGIIAILAILAILGCQRAPNHPEAMTIPHLGNNDPAFQALAIEGVEQSNRARLRHQERIVAKEASQGAGAAIADMHALRALAGNAAQFQVSPRLRTRRKRRLIKRGGDRQEIQ